VHEPTSTKVDREYSIAEVMEITGMPDKRIRAEIKAGRLLARRIGTARTAAWVIWESHLIAYQQQIKAEQEAENPQVSKRPARGRRDRAKAAA